MPTYKVPGTSERTHKKPSESGGNPGQGSSGLKVIPVSKTSASQSGTMGGGSPTGNETKRKKPPSNINSVRGGKE